VPNRLANETSPYLLQHKDNPVDWYPWADEAFAKARAEDKAIFLSIGYSSCHWCHVMERESFENPQIAAIMNQHFVNIKVDREERPDVDSIYMNAVQAMTGHGGWPMSVFITPDGKPFYAGTYFPPTDRGGMPAFPNVLQGIAEAYRDRREEMLASTDRIVEHLGHPAGAQTSSDPLTRDILSDAYRTLAPSFDEQEGGFGRAPKFPQPMTYEFLLRSWHATRDPEPLRMAERTLQKMAHGGMYDQLGGGFHRYSTDAAWLVPHFEKMLYDNAQLASLYLHAYQATGNAFYRRVVEETLAYVEREMLDPAGGFYSSQDADSEGEEGKFFVWSKLEVDLALGQERSRIVRAYYGVSEVGNFEGRNILWRPRPDEEAAAELSISVDELQAIVADARTKLFAMRSQRIAPARDDKVLTSWNALMLKAFAEAGATLENENYIDIARRNARFVCEQLRRDGRLLRSWKDGQAKLNGYLEDYAYLIEALLVLHESTFEQRWLDEATRLADSMIDLFWDEPSAVFFDTGRDHEQLVVRPRDMFDNATPSGGSSAAFALLRLGAFTGNTDYERYAVSSIRSVREYLDRVPTGFANWLAALDFYLSTPKEIAVIGPRSHPSTIDLLRVVHQRYLPNRVLAGSEAPAANATSPLPAARDMIDGKPTVYVCENYTCQLPVTTPEALAAQLDL
jgi:hypothetical protein